MAITGNTVISYGNAINLICFVGCASVFTLLESGIIMARKIGFFCNDQSIKYPLTEPTVSTVMLISIISIVGTTFILVIELSMSIYPKSSASNNETLEQPGSVSNLQVQRETLPSSRSIERGSKIMIKSGRIAAKTIMILAWYIISNGIITDVIKITVGSLRPHFLSVCNPNATCTSTEESDYQLNFICLNSASSEEDQSRRSFPSGHASMASTTMIFLIVYFLRRCEYGEKQIPIFLKLTISLSLFSLAMWISMTRVSDYHHHLIDVLFGMLLGGSIGLFGGIHATSNDKNKTNGSNMIAGTTESYTVGIPNTNYCHKNVAFNNDEVI